MLHINIKNIIPTENIMELLPIQNALYHFLLSNLEITSLKSSSSSFECLTIQEQVLNETVKFKNILLLIEKKISNT